MKEKQFLEKLAMCFLQLVSSEKYPDLEKVIVDAGGFNRRIFSPKHFFNQLSVNVIRFLVDMNLRITEEDFRKAMKEFTELILELSDQERDVACINAEHSKKIYSTFKPID
jgi:hypothetical protein